VVTAILPATPAAVPQLLSTYTTGLKVLWWTSLAIAGLTMLICTTVPRGPRLHFPSERIYSEKTLATTTNHVRDNVSGLPSSNVWGVLLFSYTTKVVLLGNTSESLEIGDLHIVTADMRATTIYADIRSAMRNIKLPGGWRPSVGSGWGLFYRLAHVNKGMLTLEFALAAVSACLFYAPAFFLQRLVRFLELADTPEQPERSWGWFYCAGLFASHAFTYILTGQLWSISTTILQARVRTQLNTLLFAKTLVRKDVASSPSTAANSAAGSESGEAPSQSQPQPKDAKEKEEGEFSSKQQVMTLMTTDVDRVGQLGWYLFPLVDSPIELAVGTLFLYKMLGSSAFIGLAVTCCK
jgi:hypothetical protein